MIDELKKAFTEEIEDSKKYKKLCDMASDELSKQIFCDISKEEMIHAMHIQSLLKKHGAWTNEMQMKWNEFLENYK